MSPEATGTAEQAAEAVRSLNHATLDPQVISPTDVYAIVGSLTRLVRYLPQALSQLQRAADGWDDRLAADCMVDDPQTALSRLEIALSSARGLLVAAGSALDQAHNASSHLYIDDDCEVDA
jgi:hypothetical protein